MAKKSGALTGDSSIGTWLDDPAGGVVMREFLAQGGQDANALKPVRRLALKRLVQMSRGEFSNEMLDALVQRAATFEAPEGADAAPATT